MKKLLFASSSGPSCLAGGVLLASLFIMAGCELGAVQDFEVSVSPRTVEIRKNQSQTFVASGGVRYEWSLSTLSSTGSTNSNVDASGPWGLLSTTRGEEVVYTSLRSPDWGDDDYIVVLTVTATMGTANASNSTVRVSSTAAYIYHIP